MTESVIDTPMKDYYKEDLAFIHDVGYGDFANKSAAGILDILHQSKIFGGLVVDLGCGSGLWALQLAQAHYDVLGIDISEAMIDIARKRVPGAEFRIASLFKARIPPCNAVTSLGECLNYLFDSSNDSQTLALLFRRIYGALAPGGVLIFDIAEPGQVKEGATVRGFSEGKDWVVLVEKEEDRSTLTRRITSFRKVGQCYRRADEVHRQRLYRAAAVARELRRAGFRVRTMRSYGQYHLPRSRAAFVARKP
jgi:SAM-dependent methyltransferase